MLPRSMTRSEHKNQTDRCDGAAVVGCCGGVNQLSPAESIGQGRVQGRLQRVAGVQQATHRGMAMQFVCGWSSSCTLLLMVVAAPSGGARVLVCMQ